jgi:DNA mismatch endonuclease (patch repair protein)
MTNDRRSYLMSRIRSKNTKPELTLRSALFKEGFRYRIHVKHLPGKPDIVFPKYKTIIFVHGCFWHQHLGCRDGRLPKTRLEYWKPKLRGNVERSTCYEADLKSLGWKVLIVWECEIEYNVYSVIKNIETKLNS